MSASSLTPWLKGYELVVGLEVHVELTTRTKMW
jgi:Asp-tRNA(Asn)/Glu-tRNA(Gln) amidotransferase B subunit